jgi:hypothetical protein
VRQVLAALALLTFTGCTSPLGHTASASPSASAKASGTIKPTTGTLHSPVPMPDGFPADVPVYPGARLTAAAGFPSTESTAWGMEWETLDAVTRVLGFYQQKMNQGDWTMKVSSSSQTVFHATFTRKSNPGVGGSLVANYNGGVTKIDLSLVTAT